MFRKKFLFVALMFAFSGSVVAQEAEKAVSPRRSLKVNVNYVQGLQTASFMIGKVAPVLMLTNKRQNVHEIELNTFDINRIEELSFTGAARVRKNVELAFRYQYDWRILKKDTGIDPYLGFSLLSGFNRTNYEPYLSSDYERIKIVFSNTFSVVPGFRYNLPQAFFLDLNIPVDLLTFLPQYQRVGNPNLPVRQQRYWSSELESSLFQQLHVRVGAGVRF